jgi:hypothetical protein
MSSWTLFAITAFFFDLVLSHTLNKGIIKKNRNASKAKVLKTSLVFPTECNQWIAKPDI